MPNISERRRYPRIDIRISIQGKDLRNRSALSISTESSNISAGGIRFIADKFISLACRLVLEMDLPAISKPVKAISKVVWIRKRSENNDFDTGSQFLEMSREDKEVIAKFVNSKLEEKT